MHQILKDLIFLDGFPALVLGKDCELRNCIFVDINQMQYLGWDKYVKIIGTLAFVLKTKDSSFKKKDKKSIVALMNFYLVG